MRERRVTLPELALVAGTRVVLGAGLGLLLAGRLNDDQRRAAGWALFAVGAVSTIPLVVEVLGTREALPPGKPREFVGNTGMTGVRPVWVPAVAGLSNLDNLLWKKGSRRFNAPGFQDENQRRF